MKTTEINTAKLKAFMKSCKQHLDIVDNIMQKQQSHERGSLMAKEANRFNLDLDAFLHFELGMSFHDIKKL